MTKRDEYDPAGDLKKIDEALASLEGDAVERVARIIDPQAWRDRDYYDDYRRLPASEHHATKSSITKARAILATGLVAGEAAVRADWHTTGWDRARNSGRILLVWSEFAGVREHIELGWYSDSKAAWVNTYGHPFHAEPDGWASLLPFKTAEAIRADEREKCAKVADAAMLRFADLLEHHKVKDAPQAKECATICAKAAREIADAIRSGDVA